MTDERRSVGCPECVDCEGEDHHWMLDANAAHPEGFMVCKHCEATRPLTDADFDEDA
jgi:hypothetical protein